MDKLDLSNTLYDLDQRGLFVFTSHDLRVMFPNESEITRKTALKRHVKDGLLTHACRGIYVNHRAKSFDGYVLEHIAKALRRGEYNYLSLESMLSEYGLISQMTIDYLTVMTTGRSQLYITEYGRIEFTHTSKNVMDVLDQTSILQERPLRTASKELALRDLRRVGRNIHMLEDE